MLSGLSFCIKCSGHQSPSERTIVQQTTVFTCQWNALHHALVNNVGRNFGQTVHVCLTGTIIASFDSIIKQPESGISVALIIFCRVNSSLCCNRVRTTWRILKAKSFYVIAQFSQSCSCRTSSKSSSNNDNIDITFVGRIY